MSAPTLAQLTGLPGGPPARIEANVVESIAALGDAFTAATGALGAGLAVDPFEVVTRRARLAGLRRAGTISCGGACHLLRVADGWLAVSLARPSDRDLLPAWLGEPFRGDWVELAAVVRTRLSADLRAQASLLGLPVGVLGERRWSAGPIVPAEAHGEAAPWDPRGPALGGLRVVDCSSLWAGPLCARLLEIAGASVTKVESAERPDGARAGNAAFFASLRGRRTERRIALSTAEGRAEFAELIAGADVVIEGSRPRAFAQLGIDAATMLSGNVRVWISITGHGRVAAPERVGFGDDAAIAGGLAAHVVRARGETLPVFLGDAIADPLTGLAAATEAVRRLAGGGRWLLDAALSRTASFVARESPC